jgi:rfaE bifunctional protein nucleotidyltransferase chain/domain
MDIEGGTLQAAARERYVQAHFGHPDMLVVVDYNKGMCTGMLPWLLERSASLKVLAPKPSNVTQRMPGISLVSCNLAEATDIVGPALIARLALNLRWHCAAEHVIITDGQRGVFGSGPQYEYVANSNGNAAVDATGAGDIVVAAAAHGLLHQYSPAKRLEWAAACADAYVSDPCAWANNPLDAFKVLGSKHPHYKQLDMRWLLQLKRGADNCGIKRRLGATCGVFDVLHDGHIRFLHDATAGANFLVVFINSDASVRRLKGEGRPIMTVEQRVAALSALPFVHAVVVFDGDSPAEHLVALRPDAFYKGPTTEEPIPEEAALNAVGCLVIKMPVLRSNESTTQIIQRSAECQKANEQTPAGNG